MATGTPNYAITPNTGVSGTPGTVSIGDSSRTNPTAVATVLSAGASGSRIERLSFLALGETIASVVRLFLYDGSNYHPYYELGIPSSSVIAGSPAWSGTLEAVNTPNLMPLLIPAGWSLRASINDTQIAQEEAFNSIAQAQTIGAAGFLNLNGSAVTAGNTTAIMGLAAPSTNVPMVFTSVPYVLTNPGQISLTSAANLSAINFVLFGRDPTGAPQSETITGPNVNTVYSANVYKGAVTIIPSGSSASTLSVGYSTFGTPPNAPWPTKVTLFSAANLSAINFILTGIGANGATLTETLAGPNAGIVTSVNSYAGITSVKTSAAVATNVQVGNPPILSGISIVPNSGNF